MTDEEEMARLYLIEKYGLRKDIEIERIQHSVCLSLEFYTYLAGLKAGEKLGFEKGIKTMVNTTTVSDCPAKPVWHSVADGDLPEYDKLVIVKRKGAPVDVDYLYRQGWSSILEGYEVDDPIAWCEIPKYTEE